MHELLILLRGIKVEGKGKYCDEDISIIYGVHWSNFLYTQKIQTDSDAIPLQLLYITKFLLCL